MPYDSQIMYIISFEAVSAELHASGVVYVMLEIEKAQIIVQGFGLISVVIICLTTSLKNALDLQILISNIIIIHMTPLKD